jgi:hypothetical protein
MKVYHKNPRQITRQQYDDLEAWMAEFGDLGGIVVGPSSSGSRAVHIC